MSLLDVPPEIFQQVIEIYVSTFGVRKAMNVRLVSKSFLLYINEEIFARQPVSKLKAKIPNRLLRENLALFLERRTVARYGAPDLLPSLITEIVDYIINVVEDKTEDNRGSWTKKVISAIVDHSPDALHVALDCSWRKRRELTANSTSCLALAVAIHSEDQALVIKILELGQNPWIASHLFGADAFYLATKVQSTQLIRVLLSTAGTKDCGWPRKCLSDVIRKCTHLALSNDNTDIAIDLFSWHVEHLGKPQGLHCSAFVEKAVAIDALAFLQTMQKSGCLDPKKALHTGDIIDGLLENPKPQGMLHYFELNHFLRPQKRYGRSKHFGAQSLIDYAVRRDCFPLAEAILAVSDDLETAGRSREALSSEDRRRVELFLEKSAAYRNNEVA